MLRELESAQHVEWLASKRAALLSERIKLAIAAGAEVEPGSLYYDPELEMVRPAWYAAGQRSGS